MSTNSMASSSSSVCVPENTYRRLYAQAFKEAFEIFSQLAFEEHPTQSLKANRARAEKMARKLADDHLRLQLG